MPRTHTNLINLSVETTRRRLHLLLFRRNFVYSCCFLYKLFHCRRNFSVYNSRHNHQRTRCFVCDRPSDFREGKQFKLCQEIQLFVFFVTLSVSFVITWFCTLLAKYVFVVVFRNRSTAVSCSCLFNYL